VRRDGVISIPKIGEVNANGITIDALAAAIGKDFAFDSLRFPR
jgi:protein involved in polysaccharide export with SLBB domain